MAGLHSDLRLPSSVAWQNPAQKLTRKNPSVILPCQVCCQFRRPLAAAATLTILATHPLPQNNFLPPTETRSLLLPQPSPPIFCSFSVVTCNFAKLSQEHTELDSQPRQDEAAYHIQCPPGGHNRDPRRRLVSRAGSLRPTGKSPHQYRSSLTCAIFSADLASTSLPCRPLW